MWCEVGDKISGSSRQMICGKKKEESYKRQVDKKESHGPAFGAFFEMGGESHI